MSWGELFKLGAVFTLGAIFGMVLAIWLVIPLIWDRKDKNKKVIGQGEKDQ